MPRPARAQWVTRAYARRRHRSWHQAMILATIGWGTWWCVLLLHRLVPTLAVPLWLPTAIATPIALLGLVVAVWTVRARRAWLLFALAPLFANASLLLVPWLVREWVGE